MIYLDNNATTRVADEVVDAMRPYYTEIFGNPHSAHTLGRRAHEGLERARGEVANLLNAAHDEIFFTSCGTESNALVLRGFGSNTSRRKVVVSSVEHPSVNLMVRQLADQREVEVATVGVDGAGRLDLDQMRELVDESTAIVAVMLAQNETGVIHDVASVAEIAHAKGAHLLVDAVQAAGKIPIDVGTLGADFLSISGHKFHAPKGIGALFIRRGLKLAPMWRGGGQESGLRSGTEPVALAVGLGTAARLAGAHLSDFARVRELRDAFEDQVKRATPTASVNGHGVKRLPNTSNISFEGLYGDEIVLKLDEAGICVSAGAACHSGNREPGAVMKAMHKPVAQALGTVRFSLSRFTTKEEIDHAANVTCDVVQALPNVRVSS